MQGVVRVLGVCVCVCVCVPLLGFYLWTRVAARALHPTHIYRMTRPRVWTYQVRLHGMLFAISSE